jgi:hypothetical protein
MPLLCQLSLVEYHVSCSISNAILIIARGVLLGEEDALADDSLMLPNGYVVLALCFH